VQTDELLTVSLDESGNWNASGKQVAEFENNFGFASLDSIIMEKDAKYTNRVIAGTDEVQDVVKIDPRTLQPSGFGTKMETSHVHEALRDYLGLSNTSTAQIFPFNNAEKFNFFG